MQKNRVFSIITIVCFCSIIFIPIGLVIMWFSTQWKKKLKTIFSIIFTILYVVLVYLLLNLQPSYNTSGVSLPINYADGETAYETTVTTDGEEESSLKKGKSKTDDKNNLSNQDEKRLPKTIKKQNAGKNTSRIFPILFFFFMLFLILWQNHKNSKKKSAYENPYVDTNQYKLPLSEDSKMPMVHFLRLRMNAGEKIFFATETTQKENEGDFIVTNQRVVVFSKGGDYEFPLSALTAVSSVTNSVMLLTSGERKYYIFMPESQMKYALAVVRWAYSKAN